MPESIAWLLIATAALALAVALTAVRSRRRRAAPRPGKPPAKTGPRSGRAPAKTAPAKKPQTPTKAPTPAAGEIWWADVPFHGADGSKVRPCLVLRRTGANAVVLKITSQDQSDRDDHIRIPTQAWDHGADHDSYLDLSDPYTVPAAKFERRVGQIDAASWKFVRAQHNVDARPRS